MYCKICGKYSGELKYCSEECRNISIKKHEALRILDGVKYKDHLDKTLDYCKRMGITYAEYQKRRGKR